MEEQKEISETGTKGIGVKQENEGVLKTVADFVSTFVVTIVVIIAILLVIGRFTGIHLFNVESGSMTPEYPVGTLLIDKETYEAEYFSCHPCLCTSTIKLKTSDVKNMLLPKAHHEPIVVEL